MHEVFNRASSASVSKFPLKGCGNDRSKLNLFMQRLCLLNLLDFLNGLKICGFQNSKFCNWRLTMIREKVLFYRQLWAISSGVERFLHTEEVAGSKPASPTNKINMLRNFLNFGFFSLTNGLLSNSK